MRTKHLFAGVSLLFFIALSISSFAQPIDWLNGKWLAAGEIFEIDGNTIQKTVDGSSIQLGEFIIDEDNCLSVDGKPIGLVISLESQSLSYSTNPEYHFPKYENLSLAPKFSFLIGSWTDGSNVISITEKNIIVKQGDYVVDKGIFFVDDNGFVNAYWEKGNFQDGLIVGGDVLSIEGGDSLIKLPEQSSNAEETSDILSTLTLSSKPYDGDIKWIYGLWKLPDSKAEIYITPKYFQARGANDSYLEGKEITELEKVPYVVKEEDNKLLGTIIKVGDYYLDISSQLLYSLSGLDKRSYLEKTENYVSPLIKYGKWVLLGLIGITALVFLLILIIRLLKKCISTLKQWRLKTKEKLAIKSQEAKKKATELRGIVKEKAVDISTRAKDIGGQAQNAAQRMAQNINDTGEAEGLDISKIKKWAYIAIVAIAFVFVPRLCDSGSSSHWVGVYEAPSWRIELRKDKTATVSGGGHDLETEWEDGGDFAVVGAYRGEVFLISRNGNLSIRGTDGHVTGLLRLKKTK